MTPMQAAANDDDFLPFDMSVQKSPRRAWVERYDVDTELARAGKWCAWSNLDHKRERFFGSTEDDAIAALAQARTWKLWNEEAPL